jgi:hypothetical protein
MWVLGFDSRRGLGIFLFTTASRTALGTTKPPIQWVPGALSLGVKRPGREADHSPPSSAEVKNAWSCISTPQYVFMAWCLVKHRDNFTFTFYFAHLHIMPRLRMRGTIPPLPNTSSWHLSLRKTTKTSVRMAGNSTEIQTSSVLNTRI